MKNLYLQIEHDTLWIGIDLTQRTGAPGVIATTNGAVSPDGRPDIKVEVNVRAAKLFWCCLLRGHEGAHSFDSVCESREYLGECLAVKAEGA